jgi:Ca2+-binding RTX toxin-like protein
VGSNDYLNYLSSNLPKDLATAGKIVANVIGSINSAIDDLTAAGVTNIALFTLPDLAITPALQAQGAAAQAFAHGLDVANNAALKVLAALHPDVQLVDMFKLSDAVAADPSSFGLSDVTIPMIDLPASAPFAPNEVGFFDDDHPTFAGHGIQASFADAVLGANHVQFLDGTQHIVDSGPGNNFIFATPVSGRSAGNYTIFGGPGSDQIFAGSGNVTVYGGSGTELIAAGSGNAKLYGGSGTDVLATNSEGTNLLVAGNGNDALIANRGGTNHLQGGMGDDLFVLKENASLVNSHGTFNFGNQTIDGGQGQDTLRFVINDQIPAVMDALETEFQQVDAAFQASMASNHPGTFHVDGLNVTGIDQLQLEVDSVSTDPNTHYLITHNMVASDGSAPVPTASLSALLTTAGQWGLLTA